MSSTVLDMQGVSKTYESGPNRVQALDNINLSIERGTLVSIMGPSGCGKTTLLNIVGCLDNPTSGTVTLDSIDLTSVPRRELPGIRAQKIGFIFQTFNLMPTLSVLENVELPMERGTVPRKSRRERGIALLEQVGLTKRISHRPNQLSSGEQQRVAIARALANNPAMILGDEPTGNLDSKTGLSIIKILRTLSADSGVTIMMVTHDRAIASLGDRMLFLRDGKLLKEERKGTLAPERGVRGPSCPSCGRTVAEDFVLCPYCGAQLSSSPDEDGSKREGKPPHELCGGTPSADLCPICSKSTLKGGDYYCSKYQRAIPPSAS